MINEGEELVLNMGFASDSDFNKFKSLFNSDSAIKGEISMYDKIKLIVGTEFKFRISSKNFRSQLYTITNTYFRFNEEAHDKFIEDFLSIYDESTKSTNGNHTYVICDDGTVCRDGSKIIDGTDVVIHHWSGSPIDPELLQTVRNILEDNGLGYITTVRDQYNNKYDLPIDTIDYSIYSPTGINGFSIKGYSGDLDNGMHVILYFNNKPEPFKLVNFGNNLNEIVENFKKVTEGLGLNTENLSEKVKSIYNESSDNQDAKADAGKVNPALVPSQIVWDIAEVREYGNRKYGDPENWKEVSIDRYIAALYRHFLAFIEDRNSIDSESGIEHYKHMACNMAFICHMMNEEKHD